MAILELDKDKFDEEVLKEKKLTLVDFWGPQCATCIALMPFIETMSNKYSNDLKVMKISVDGNRRFFMGLKVAGLPTMIFFKNGVEIKRLSGPQVIPQNIEKSIMDNI